MVPFDLPGIFDSDTIWGISYVPKSLVVQGGGIVGLEYAQIFAKLGSKVVVVEFFDKIAAMLDTDLQKACIDTLEECGVEILLSTPINKVEEGPHSTRANPRLRVDAGGRWLECDCLLSAVGR